MDKNQKNKYEQEGVYYTPSSASSNQKTVKKTAKTSAGSSAKPNPSPNRKKKKKKKGKSQFAYFYVATLFIGVLVGVVVFAIVFQSVFSEQQEQERGQITQTTPKPSAAPVVTEKMTEAIGLIKEIRGESRQIVLYDMDNTKTQQLAVKSDTEMKNRYGQAIAFPEIAVGDIVEVSFGADNNQLDTLFQSAQGWEHKGINNVKFDLVEQTITIGNNQYNYNDQLVVLSKGLPYELSRIQAIDKLTVKGYKDTAYYVELTKSHGYIEFVNKSQVRDGIVEIGTTIAQSLDVSEKQEVLEGPHQIVVKGSNIEPITKEVQIEPGATYTVDLSQAQYKNSVLSVTVNQEEYKLTIGGNEYSAKEPILLEYGEYSVEVTKEGFVPYQTNITIANPSHELNVTLKQEVKLCKLTLTTIPSGAEIYIDNSYMGTTPLTVEIEYGVHKIVPKKAGYQTNDFNLTFNTPTSAYELALPPEIPVIP